MSRRGRLALLVLAALILVGLAVWRAPSLGHALGVLASVSVGWLVAALAVNLVSVGLRTAAWRVIVVQAVPAPPPAPSNHAAQIAHWTGPPDHDAGP